MAARSTEHALVKVEGLEAQHFAIHAGRREERLSHRLLLIECLLPGFLLRLQSRRR
jgi:hypothetical protein